MQIRFVAVLVSLGALVISPPAIPSETSSVLFQLAKRSLEDNIEAIGTARFLTAGRHQFKSLWTRDFCFSSRGLLELGHEDVVRNQLTLLLDQRRQRDHLIPRTLDSILAQKRVTSSLWSHLFPWIHSSLPIGAPLRAEYVEEHGTEAIDSNVLVLLTAIQYVEYSGDFQWWSENEEKLVQVYRYYDFHKTDDLVVQPAFSDWQDSVRREGHTFLTNLLYFVVSEKLRLWPAFHVDSNSLEFLRGKIERTFYDHESGLYRSQEGRSEFSLDGNLLALDLGYLAKGSSQASFLFMALSKHPLWTIDDGMPGFATFPDYPLGEISFYSRAVGLRHYHDQMYWSWLMGLALKIARQYNDRATEGRLFNLLTYCGKRDGGIAEIYDGKKDFQTWKSPVFESESPFSWGAAFVIDALQ